MLELVGINISITKPDFCVLIYFYILVWKKKCNHVANEKQKKNLFLYIPAGWPIMSANNHLSLESLHFTQS